ncbi:ATP-dependent helicase [Idiomarina abyssalis]|uniref:DNA 3'-5' helicase n=1 Tax=Idiomarina abyssalis TaxID=86102 RepID=A0A8I1GAX0_9GAMM|nr:ATP-dependent helicase [Idiomarina abyssalis]MBJ7265471.1 ATP-dependent helicase [Idiomarina abyssalis]MBJ7316855.1 ATP-dependent helicase [Idiomarina abyssalis]
MSNLNGLNSQQKIAASQHDGVIRVMAGPGTGKTKTKVSRLANMIDTGFDPERLVGLTFTNKAADEMRQRLIAMCDEGKRAFIGTYHSFFIQRILRPNDTHDYFQKLGYTNGFYTLDQNDANGIMTGVMKRAPKWAKFAIDALGTGKKDVFSFMGKQRAVGGTAQQFLKHCAQDKSLIEHWAVLKSKLEDLQERGAVPDDSKQTVQEAFNAHPSLKPVFFARLMWMPYSNECVRFGGIDFDDVLVHARNLIAYDPELATNLSKQHSHFSLDEFQDTNQVQFDVIRRIVDATNKPANLFLVGDTRQSIYGFRSADVRLMSELHKTYPDVVDVELTTNYRSQKPLIAASNSLARTMNGQITEGQLNTPNDEPADKPTIAAFDNEYEEAAFVVEQVRKQAERGDNLDNTAVLYRGRNVRTAVENALMDADISFEVIGDVDFWERREVRDMLGIIRFALRNNDYIAAYRVLDHSTLPMTSQTLKKHHTQNNTRPFAYLREAALPSTGRATIKSKQIRPFFERIQAITDALPLIDLNESTEAWEKAFLKNLAITNPDQVERNAINKALDCVKPDSFKQLGNVLKGIYVDYLYPKQVQEDQKEIKRKQGSEAELTDRLTQRLESVEQVTSLFVDQMKKGLTARGALEELTLRAEAQPDTRKSAVKLLTNHAAKGLEFDTTYLIGTEQQTYFREEYPDDETLDEECRNFYVGITRAQRQLTMTYAHQRTINGEVRYNQPLTFLSEIRSECDCRLEQQDEAVLEQNATTESVSKHSKEPHQDYNSHNDAVPTFS